MADLRSRVLLDSPLVGLADVACHAPRSKAGPAEDGGAGFQLVVPRRGVFCVHSGSSVVAADPNSVLLLGGHAEYRFSHPVHGGDDCTAVALAPALAEEALGPRPARHGPALPRAQLRAGLLTAMLARGALSELESEEAALALVAELAASLKREANLRPRVTPAAARRVQEVRTLLAADPATDWRLADVAHAVHCSPFHLARQFRAVTGETIARYLLRLRLAAALQRVTAGETALARLAVELGFAHHSHFTARFRAAFGVTPSEARRIVTAGGAAAP
jgi:AraC family transcriptional regulator